MAFPRRAVAEELARTFRANARLAWADADGTRGVLDLVQEQATGPNELTLPYRRSDSYRAFVLTRLAPFEAHEIELARAMQNMVALLDSQLAEDTPFESDAQLTERETSVLALLSEGLTAVSIARRLGISPRTVQVHLRNVYRKLGVSDRLLAARIYRESGPRLARSG